METKNMKLRLLQLVKQLVFLVILDHRFSVSSGRRDNRGRVAPAILQVETWLLVLLFYQKRQSTFSKTSDMSVERVSL